MRKNYTVDEAVRSLEKKNDVRIHGWFVDILTDKILNKDGQTIPNPEKRNDLGNGSWGKIDFLTKHAGFHIRYVGTHKEKATKKKKFHTLTLA